jgi:hypothetical protein
MWRCQRQVPKVGPSDLKPVAEAVETTHVTLVPSKRLGGPRVGGVNHPHPLQHHEGIHGAAGGRDETDVGPHSAELTNEGVPDKGLRKEETPSKIPVPGPEGTAHPNAILMVRDVAGRMPDPVEDKTSRGEKAPPARGGAAGATTARAYRQPA